MQQESVDSKSHPPRWFVHGVVPHSERTVWPAGHTDRAGSVSPFTMLLSILILPPLMVAFTDRKFRPPLRMPKDCEMFDDTLTTETRAEYRLGPFASRIRSGSERKRREFYMSGMSGDACSAASCG